MNKKTIITIIGLILILILGVGYIYLNSGSMQSSSDVSTDQAIDAATKVDDPAKAINSLN